MMATIVFNPSDAALAERIQSDLAQASGNDNTSVFVLSPQAMADSDVQAAIAEAIDQHRHIVPVLAKPTPLPRLIEHLEPVDFSSGYDFDRLIARLSASSGELQMKVHTPKTVTGNRRVGLVVAFFAIVMFLAGIYGVGVMGLQAPADEYNAVETEIVQTRNAYIDAALPRSTEDALNFQATVDGAAPTLRPMLVATATALAEE
jgi:hypothetical protein